MILTRRITHTTPLCPITMHNQRRDWEQSGVPIYGSWCYHPLVKTLDKSLRSHLLPKRLIFFENFFSQDIYDVIVRETNAYAEKCIQQKADPKWSPINVADIKTYIGLNMVLSVMSVPTYTLLWSSKKCFSLFGIKEVTTCHRFTHICKNLHCNDTAAAANPRRGQPGHDNIRPVLDSIVWPTTNHTGSKPLMKPW